MKVTDKKLENARVEISVEIPVDRVQDAYVKAFAKIQKKAKIDGFRQGKIPMSIIESRFADQADGEAAEILVQETFWDALAEKKYVPINRPAYDFSVINRNEAFSYTAVFEVPPVVTVGDYLAIPAEEKVCQVKDSDIDEEIMTIRERYAESEPKEEGAPIKMGDMATMRMRRIDGLEKEELDNTPFKDYNIVIGKSKETPRIDDSLVGMKKNETKEIVIKYPKDYHIEEIANQKITYEVVITGISSLEIPPFDDEFAKKVKYASKDEMIAKTREYIEEFVRDRIRSEVKSDIITKIIEASSFEIPQSLLDQEFESIFRKTQDRVGFRHDNFDEFASVMGVDPKVFREKLMEEAEKSIKSTLVLSHIARTENLTVNQERYREIIHAIALKNSKTDEEIEKLIEDNGSRKNIETDLLLDSATEFIYEKAKVKKQKPITLAELMKGND